jgi:hypothetical protein
MIHCWEIKEEILNLDINTITPMEALMKLKLKECLLKIIFFILKFRLSKR